MLVEYSWACWICRFVKALIKEQKNNNYHKMDIQRSGYTMMGTRIKVSNFGWWCAHLLVRFEWNDPRDSWYTQESCRAGRAGIRSYHGQLEQAMARWGILRFEKCLAIYDWSVMRWCQQKVENTYQLLLVVLQNYRRFFWENHTTIYLIIRFHMKSSMYSIWNMWGVCAVVLHRFKLLLCKISTYLLKKRVELHRQKK